MKFWSGLKLWGLILSTRSCSLLDPQIIYAAVSSPEIQTTAYGMLTSDGTLVTSLPRGINENALTPNKRIADVYGNPFIPDGRRPLVASLYRSLTTLFESWDLKVRNLP